MSGYDGFLANPQSAGLILNLAIQSVLILGGSWALIRILRPGSAPLRRSLLLAGLVMGVVMPPAGLVMHAMGFSWTLQIFDFPVRESPFHGRVLDLEGQEDDAWLQSSAARESLPPGQQNSWPDASPGSEGEGRSQVPVRTSSPPAAPMVQLCFWMNIFGLAWLGGTVVMLTRLAWGWFYLVRFRQGSEPLSDPRITRFLRSMKRSRRPLIGTSDLLGSPLTTGFLRPCIMIPRSLLQTLTDEELGAVLAHELAHVQHGDFRVGHLQRLAAALYWWNPFVHALNPRLTAAMEDLCDNQAMAVVRDSRSYVECLVNVADKSLQHARLPGKPGNAAFEEEP